MVYLHVRIRTSPEAEDAVILQIEGCCPPLVKFTGVSSSSPCPCSSETNHMAKANQEGSRLCILSSLKLQLGARLEGRKKVGGEENSRLKSCRKAELPEKCKPSL